MQMGVDPAQRVLKDTEYPAEKRDLVKHAKMYNASEGVLEDIRRLPDKVYTSASGVNKELENK
ncbi:Protein of unknown function [Methanosarcina thermophila]|jgi:hypothetical protein|uniref:PRC-barrel domain protein n=1 Tax=Methanosarcina thermophila TaxID=2210 RepID=A0A1I7A6K1_METTE|nr:DUF2795 domain-containing protein [Methanosarcina thermophila]ALK06644.1 MAG: hypothetical protein AAY43_07240 [Methanosarcina sp. 795]NLU57518.1 DUF2795 domain-containing protein [Methanosarcina thermophila]SFT70554.1 Protein of unknown function [Methanosarcina thermophila]BAW29431.1 PRC-barrel domain protein [Methanosarcina thermophila]GLI13524.1 hypothetical protein MTHERMMSTA1_06500 [Methanosarcina thermophila MST-A1]